MTIRWPDALPQCPLISGYDETPPDTVLRTQMDAGPAKTRQRFSTGVRVVNWAMVLTLSETEILDDFFTGTTYGGSLSFMMIDPRTKVDQAWRFQGPPKYTALSGDKFSTKMVIEMLPAGGVGIAGPTDNTVPPGGAAGYHLAKASNADFDTYWVAPDIDDAPQLPNRVKAGPAVPGAPSAVAIYRTLVTADIP